ncbi:MAG: flippase-like domain-containing protein [Gemmatimonadaceae bacterium]|nr:flippase-like domain-containing protein [Gemmatimonadaceae bacterium]
MRLGWRGAIGLLVSAALLWWVLRDADLPRVWIALRGSNASLWAACTVFATLIFPLRARRWQALLAPTYGRLPLAALWQSTAVGMMVNNVAPLRAGEFARAFALTRAAPEVKFAAAFGSLAVDRLFDGTIVLLLMLAATLDPAFPAGQTINGTPLSAYLRPVAAFLGVVLLGALTLLFAPQVVARTVNAVAGALAPKLAPRIHALLAGFVDGLRVLRSPGLMAEVVAWTLIHWLCNAFAFWLGFKALGITAPFSAALLLQGLIAIAVAAPSSPGFFGLFEASGTIGLGIYGVAAAPAVAWALGFHILSYIPITLIGGWYLTRMRLRFTDFIRAAGATDGVAPAGSPADEAGSRGEGPRGA